jgi:hypothetical protein
MLATLQSSKYFFHSVQIVSPLDFSRSTELAYRRAAEHHEARRVLHFITDNPSVSPFQCDPHTRSQRISSTTSSCVHTTSFVSLDQMLCTFIIPFVAILISVVVPYTLPDIFSNELANPQLRGLLGGI